MNRQPVVIMVFIVGSAIGCGDTKVARPPDVTFEVQPSDSARPTSAQDVVTESNDRSSATPPVAPAFTDSKTGIAFPPSLGKLNFVELHRYPQAGLGYSLRYEFAETIKLDLYVYDMDRIDIPTGYTDRIIVSELKKAEADIYTIQQRGAYRDVQKLDEGVFPKTIEKNGIGFQSSRFQLRQASGPKVAFTGLRISETFLCGCQGHFIKVRFTYPASSAETSIVARDEVMRSVAAILRAPK